MSDDKRRALPPFPSEKPALAHDSSTNNPLYFATRLALYRTLVAAAKAAFLEINAHSARQR